MCKLACFFYFFTLIFVNCSQFLVQDPENTHISLIIGSAKCGKNTFVWNLDQDRVIVNGNSQYKIIMYKNYELIAKQTGIAIIMDLSQIYSFEDGSNILFHLIRDLFMGKLRNIRKLDTIYFIQSLQQLFNIEKYLNQMKIVFGNEILKAATIIYTFSDLFETENHHYNQKTLKSKINVLINIQQEFEVAGGLINFSGDYIEKDSKSNQKLVKKQQRQQFINQVKDTINKLQKFDLQNYKEEQFLQKCGLDDYSKESRLIQLDYMDYIIYHLIENSLAKYKFFQEQRKKNYQKQK